MSRFVTNIFSKLTAQTKAFSDLDKNSTKFHSSNLRDFLEDYANSMTIHIVDNDYLLLDPDILKNILKADGTDRYVYRKEGGDCDNFAFALMGRIKEMEILCDLKEGTTFGFIKGSIYLPGKDEPVRHAMNFVVYKDKKNDGKLTFKLIEPQNDKFIDHDPRNYYDLVLV